MRRRRAVNVLAVAAVLALSGCSVLGGDARLSELDKDQAKQAGREATEGVLAGSEIDCVLDKLLARSDFTVGQINDYVREPALDGPVAKAYQEAVPGCLDRNASVPAVPLSDEFRTGLLNGIKAGAPGTTDAQAACLLDGILARGVTPRDLTLGGYDQAILEERVLPAATAAAETCG